MIYRIDIKLASKASFVEVPVFDGILAYCAACEYFGEPPVQSNQIEIIDFDLPLCYKKTTDGNIKVYNASRLFWDGEDIETTAQWVKKWDNVNDDLADFGKKKAKIEIQKGQFKNYQVNITVHSFLDCYFYFESNDVSKVELLLKKWLKGIGKKNAQGFGLIDSFEIVECQQVDFDTFLLRPTPKILVTADQLVNTLQYGYKAYSSYCGYKAPYWHQDNFAECWSIK